MPPVPNAPAAAGRPARAGLRTRLARNRGRQRELYGAPLGDRVRRLTAGLGITQGRLAQTLGVSPAMLSQLASARRVKIGDPAVLARLQLLDRPVRGRATSRPRRGGRAARRGGGGAAALDGRHCADRLGCGAHGAGAGAVAAGHTGRSTARRRAAVAPRRGRGGAVCVSRAGRGAPPGRGPSAEPFRDPVPVRPRRAVDDAWPVGRLAARSSGVRCAPDGTRLRRVLNRCW